VRHSALRRAVGACVVLSASAMLLGNSVVGTTFASFNGETSNANSAFAGGWIGAPTLATAVPSGYDMSLNWTPGTHGPVTGQQLFGVDNTTNSSCTGAAYVSLTGLATASTAAYTDPSRGTAANNGNWYCYQLVSTSLTSWTASLALPAVQLGLVTKAVQITNGGTANRIEKNDTIKLTFNQRTNLPTTNIKVCTYPTVIVIGDPTSGNNCAASPPATSSVGRLTITGATIPSVLSFNASTVALTTASAPWTATITLLGTNSTATMTGTPTSWAFTASSSVLSFATTHQATMCSATTANCQPTTATNF
jgi:hypothetical protein